MRKINVSEYVTLDGVMEDPGGADKTEHGGWSFQFWSEESAKYKFDELFASDALLLGRVTYQGFAKTWPTMKNAGEFGDRMNNLPKFVFSRSLKDVDWKNSTLIKGNVLEEVSRLKQQPGQDILVSGSGELVYTLIQHDLIDEYRLMIHPVVLGSGKRLFKDGTYIKALTLVSSTPLAKGIVVLTYQPDKKE